MKRIFTLLLFFALLSQQACLDNDCGDCTTSPQAFVFELVDKDTKENLFTNGTLNKNNIHIINTADDSDVEYTFISENDVNLIVINSIGWKTEKVTALVKVGETDIFTLYVDAERLHGDCCDYTKYNEYKIENVAYEIDQTRGVFEILIDTTE